MILTIKLKTYKSNYTHIQDTFMNIKIIFCFLVLISYSYAETTDNDVLSQFTKGVADGAIDAAITELIIKLILILLPIKLVMFILTLIIIIFIGYLIFDSEFRKIIFDYLFSYEGIGYFTGCFLTHRITSSIKN